MLKKLIIKIYLHNSKMKIFSLNFIIILSVFFIIYAFFMGSEASTSVSGWNRKLLFSPRRSNVVDYDSAARGNFIALVYETIQDGKQSISARISVNSGKDFLPPLKIASANISDEDKPYKMNPKVAVSGSGKVTVVWQDFDTESFDPVVYYSTSGNYYKDWSKPKELKFSVKTQFLPKILYDEKNRLHVFYHGLKNSKFYLYHTVADSMGNFTETKELFQLTGNFRGAFFPAIKTYGNNIFLIWQGKSSVKNVLSDDLYFVRSTDYGKSWGQSVQITWDKADDSSPDLAIIDGKLYCVYMNNSEGNREAYLKISSDYGMTWSDSMKIVKTNVNVSSLSIIKNYEGEPEFFWSDNSDGISKIFTRKYTINDPLEKKLTEPVAISENKSPALNPVVLQSGRQLLCIWKESSVIFAKFSDIYVSPPKVFSRTHPFENWSKKSAAVISWEKPQDESGIAGYAVIVNKDPYFNPTVQNIEANIRTTRAPFLEDGVNYFHIRAIDGAGNYSRTVHFPLLVSSTSLPMPEISSKTHPENKRTDSNTGVITWTQRESIRLKGFRYSFSKGSVKPPTEFINTNEFSFNNLEDGRYFFTLVPIDKTNSIGNEATYIIVIGDVEEIDPKYYEKIAEGNETKVKEPKKKYTYKKNVAQEPIKPQIIIEELNDVENEKIKKFKISITNRNLFPGLFIEGYSYYIAGRKVQPDNEIDTRENIVIIDKMGLGKNFICIAAKYSYKKNNRIVEEWTDVHYGEFDYSPSPVWSPLEEIENILERNKSFGLLLSIILMSVCILMVIFSSSSEIFVLYFKILNYRIFVKLKLYGANVLSYFKK